MLDSLEHAFPGTSDRERALIFSDARRQPIRYSRREDLYTLRASGIDGAFRIGTMLSGSAFAIELTHVRPFAAMAGCDGLIRSRGGAHCLMIGTLHSPVNTPHGVSSLRVVLQRLNIELLKKL